MLNRCIFCREEKEANEFSLEHVFPATIGGAFVITTVCKKCNETLGRIIDNPFSRYHMVTWYRNIFQIKRKDRRNERKIPNPIKGKHKDDYGNEYYIQFDEKGQPVSHTVPKYEPPEPIEGGFIGKLTIPLKDFTNEDEIVKKYAKKFGLDPTLIKIQDKQVNEANPVNVRIDAENNVFILGVLKIAYEYATTFLPDYINDPLAKVFSEILLTKNIISYHKNLFDYDHSAREIMTQKLENIEGITIHHHAAMLTTITGKGLVCGVRIFNWTYAIRLSEREDYLQTDRLLILNDAIKQDWWMNIKTRITNFRIAIETINLNRQQRRILKFNEKKDFADFKTPKGNLPVYDVRGTMIHKNMGDLAYNLPIHPSYYNHFKKEIVVPVNYRKGQYFIKSKKDNLLFPLLSVHFIYKLLY